SSAGFAVPIERALSIARQIESGHGTATVHVGPTAFIGIEVSSSGDQGGAGSNYGYGYGDGSSVSGAAVGGVVDREPAQQAGLQAADVITSLDGHAIDSATALPHLLVAYHPGDSVTLRWVDANGQSHSSSVTLATGSPA